MLTSILVYQTYFGMVRHIHKLEEKSLSSMAKESVRKISRIHFSLGKWVWSKSLKRMKDKLNTFDLPIFYFWYSNAKTASISQFFSNFFYHPQKHDWVSNCKYLWKMHWKYNLADLGTFYAFCCTTLLYAVCCMQTR